MLKNRVAAALLVFALTILAILLFISAFQDSRVTVHTPSEYTTQIR
ncbi:MAG: hypothetical protein MR290_07055 [Ruminococcus sp.]|nr:hypothetical protein [Ruminococcus sp.]